MKMTRQITKVGNLLPVFLALLQLSSFAGSTTTSASVVDPVKTSYIVTLRREADQDGCAKAFGVQRHHIYHHALNGFAANLDAATVEKLKHDPRVLAVEPDGDVVLDVTTVIPAGQLTNQIVPSGILRMGLTNFPMTHMNGQDNRVNVDVAVLDTGVQLDHPDLNVYLPGSASFADGSTNGSDWQGHGTHVAGILGALDNSFGVVGVAPGVRVWSVEVVGPTQHAVANLLAGLDHISQHADQISVVNASITIIADIDFVAIHQAVANIINQGVVFVAAAGNSESDLSGDFIWGNEDDNLPAGLPEVMAVSAMDPNPMQFNTNAPLAPGDSPNPGFDTIWFLSNYSVIRHDPSLVLSPGFAMDVAAPGVNILSTYKGSNYAIMTGTSMASPHAAGLVALYIAANGRATNAAGVYKIRQAIVDNSRSQTNWTPGGQPAYFYTTNFGMAVSNTEDPDGNFEPLAMPSENWVPAPTITGETMTAQGFQLNFMTVPGYTYTVQQTDSLNPSNAWTNLTSTNGAGSLTAVTVTDPTPSITSFYRVMREPTP
jgi:subtilisin